MTDTCTYSRYTYPGAAAYKDAEGIPIHHKKILVDVERGRTVKGWKPHKLGGGLGGRPKPVDPVAVAPPMAPVFGGFRGGMRGGDRGGFRGVSRDFPSCFMLSIFLGNELTLSSVHRQGRGGFRGGFQRGGFGGGDRGGFGGGGFGGRGGFQGGPPGGGYGG